MAFTIRKATEGDWEQIKALYEAGIATGNATFETETPNSYHDWASKLLESCSLVAHDGKHVLGWCKLSPVSDRCVYAGVGEVSVYIHPEARGKGIGNALLNALIQTSEAQGFWTLTAGIFPENTASMKLHTKNGFRIIGNRERIGKMKGVWRDVAMLERRSEAVGVD